MCAERLRVAALFVETSGAYFGLPHVDPYDVKRDATTYRGPLPVVAHPPCTRWCRLAGLVEARWGHERGDDGGLFALALEAVRMHGGILEHPAYTKAWPAFELAKPPRLGGWIRADNRGGYTCHVEQVRYGHAAKKATWLYANGTALPELRWGSSPDRKAIALVSWCGNRVKSTEKRPRLSTKQAKATPIAFRDTLIAIAASWWQQ